MAIFQKNSDMSIQNKRLH